MVLEWVDGGHGSGCQDEDGDGGDESHFDGWSECWSCGWICSFRTWDVFRMAYS